MNKPAPKSLRKPTQRPSGGQQGHSGHSGHTLAQAAHLLRAAGAASVDVAVTHALFVGDALQTLAQAGVGEVWSTDCIAHPSNAVFMAESLARALQEVLQAGPGPAARP